MTISLARTDLLRDSAYIDGKWVAGETSLEVENPATGQCIGTVPNLGADAAREAVAAAIACSRNGPP